MASPFRKLTNVAHMVTSLAWLGAAAAFLALSVTGLTSRDAATVRAVYVAMKIVAGSIVLPLSLASLATGLLLALGTKWGLTKHEWIRLKLVVTLLGITALIGHLQPMTRLAADASARALAPGELLGVRIQMVVTPAAAILVLLALAGMSVYKPRGGRRTSPSSKEATAEA